MEDNKFSFKELGTISIDLPYAWFEVKKWHLLLKLLAKKRDIAAGKFNGLFSSDPDGSLC